MQATIQLITMMILAGLMLGYVKVRFGGKGRILMRIGLIVGGVSSVIMTYMKTTTNKVSTAMWNLRIFAVSAACFVLFLLIAILLRVLKKAGPYIMSAVLALMTAAVILYYLPDFLEYPYTMLLTEESVLSTTFILKMVGAIFGLILTFVAGLAVYKGTLRLGKKLVFALTALALAVNTSKYVASSFSILLAKRMIATNHTLFVIAKYASNYSSWFIYATLMITAVIPIVIFVKSLNVNEPYTNPAERRKIIAKWRINRRWCLTAVITFALTVVVMTAVNSYANRVVALSPIEDINFDDENMYIPFEQVSDGHLHRFGYTAEDGTVIRFIVIKKPNSSSYGVGLDACDICGETGYYEKDGQVVCNRCDVVMNINTIGFKGGCNPIIIDYSVDNGQIIVPIAGLVEHIKEFQ